MTENKKIIGKINIDLIKGEFTPKFYLIDEGERMTEKYRVHDLAKFHYSEIGEYIDENHTDRPLRNDILVDLLNQLNNENEQLKSEINMLKTTIGRNEAYIERLIYKSNWGNSAFDVSEERKTNISTVSEIYPKENDEEIPNYNFKKISYKRKRVI